MTNGLIIDTVLFWAESAVAGLGGVAFINLMATLYLPLGFLIPSSSGLATVSMPIMAPWPTQPVSIAVSLSPLTNQPAVCSIWLTPPLPWSWVVWLRACTLRQMAALYSAALVILLILYSVVLSIGVFFPNSPIF